MKVFELAAVLVLVLGLGSAAADVTSTTFSKKQQERDLYSSISTNSGDGGGYDGSNVSAVSYYISYFGLVIFNSLYTNTNTSCVDVQSSNYPQRISHNLQPTVQLYEHESVDEL